MIKKLYNYEQLIIKRVFFIIEMLQEMVSSLAGTIGRDHVFFFVFVFETVK